MDTQAVTVKSENLDEDYYSENTFVETKTAYEAANSVKTFKCGVCGHCTTSIVLLNVHMKMHFMKRTHQCDICKKCFSFVTELNNHIMTQHKCRILKRNFKLETQKAQLNENHHYASSTFKNKDPLVPLSEQEKLLLLRSIEKLEINTKYRDLENLKSSLRDSWIKIIDIFRENNFRRTSDKLSRCYFHMRNQAKVQIERFYIEKKLPRPRKIDYMFVKLFPNDFGALGLELRKLLEDGKIDDGDSTIKDDKNQDNNMMCDSTIKNEENQDDNMLVIPTISAEDNKNLLLNSPPSTSSKRKHPEETDQPKNEICSEDESIQSLRIQLFHAEDKRREIEHELEIKKKELDMQYQEKLYKNEIVIENLQSLICQKVQLQITQP